MSPRLRAGRRGPACSYTMKFQCEENVRKMSGKSEEFSACVELM